MATCPACASIVVLWQSNCINASQTRQSLVLSRSDDLKQDELHTIRC